MWYVFFVFFSIYILIYRYKKSWLTKFKESVHHLYAAESYVLKMELKNLWTHFRTYRRIILLRETRGSIEYNDGFGVVIKQIAITIVVTLSFLTALENNEFFDLYFNELMMIYKI